MGCESPGVAGAPPGQCCPLRIKYHDCWLVIGLQLPLVSHWLSSCDSLYDSFMTAYLSSSPWCRTGSPLSRWRCWSRCWGPGSPPWTRPASATPCSASWPAASTSESGASLSQPRWWWMRPAGGHPHIRISYIILLLQGCIFLIFSINRKSLRISGAWVVSVTTWTWSGKDKDSLMISSEDIISILSISILSQQVSVKFGKGDGSQSNIGPEKCSIPLSAGSGR